MRIELKTQYKSLKEPISTELPDLTIVTGPNGSGKTHLLAGLSSGEVELTINGGVVPVKQRKYVPSYGLIPKDEPVIELQNLNRDSQHMWQQCSAVQNAIKQHGPSQSWESRLVNSPGAVEVIQYVMKVTGKPIVNLTASDFYDYFPPSYTSYPVDIFQHKLGNIFKRYHRLEDKNRYERYLNSQGTQGGEVLTDEEFAVRFGIAPWTLVNRIIKEANLDFSVNSPVGSNRDAPFEVKLIHNFTGAEIKFSELSSGEKVLMSLALALYNSNFELEFPRVLLLDEPDASLHPLMSKQFLNVLQTVFVRDKASKVIMTTHSPSTVAIANEESLFVMNRVGQRLEKTSKDKALKILTWGVPSISVNYENRRQVFVESKYDVFFFEKVYEKLRTKLANEISLNFISSGTGGSGSSTEVKEIVNKLSGYGNRYIFGIIDWDRKNCSKDFVKVLGQGKRYSVENYIFDPILITAYLFREKIVSRLDLEFQNNETHSDFKDFAPGQLQNISNFLTGKIFPKMKHEPILESHTGVRYVNGIEIEVPQWYLLCQGHELEKVIVEVFPSLRRFNKEGSLKREVIEKVIDDIPELVPYDVFELLQEIQNH